MRRTLACILTMLILLPALAVNAEAGLTLIEGRLTRNIPIKSSYPDNPVVPGESSTTGLPFSGIYVPILMVVDNSPAAHPHWGVGDADVMYQAPNGGVGATKLLALFADTVPDAAGGVRSARMPFVDVALGWGSVFVYGGTPPKRVAADANVYSQLGKNGMNKAGIAFDVNANNDYSNRVNWEIRPHNLSAQLLRIKNAMITKGNTFVERPFRFTDEPQTAGVPAGTIDMKHYGEEKKKVSNSSSDSSFAFDPARNAYIRTNSSGVYVDMYDLATPIEYANVIVQRTQFSYAGGSYVVTKHVVGSGAAEIFTGGRYIAGAWSCASQGARTVFLDDQGQEIALQRGKTFIVITNDVTEVSYGP